MKTARKKVQKKSSRSKVPASSSAVDSCVFRKSRLVLERKSPEGPVSIIKLNDEEDLYRIDDMAAEFWSSIDGVSNVLQIKQKLIRKYNPPLARFNRDVAKLVRDLQKENLIDPV